MADFTPTMSKWIRGRSFEFASCVGCRAISDHLNFVSFVPGFDSLVAVVGRSHVVVLWRAAVQLHWMFRAEIDIFHPIAAVLHRFLQERPKSSAELGEIDSILRPLRSSYPWLNLAEIQFQIDAVIDFALARHAKHLLRAKVIFERGALLVSATGGAQIIHRFLINWEISNGRAVLRRHVADGGTIGYRQGCRAFAIKLDEFPDYLLRPQHLGDVQDEIGCSDAFLQAPAQMHAHDFRRQKINRLPEHPSFRFNSAHAPTDDTKPIDHGGV